MRKLLIIAAVAVLGIPAPSQTNPSAASAPPAQSTPATGAQVAPAAPTQTTPTHPAPATATVPANWPTAQYTTPAAKDPSVQKAKQILDVMIKALGGEAYLNVQSMTSEGRAYAFYQGRPSGMGVQFWRFWQWPDKERIELTKERDIVELYVGDKGYEITYKGTATQDLKALDNYLRRRAHSIENVVRVWLPAPGSMIIYSGTAIVERNLADEVTVLNGDNDSVTIAVDPFSHLPTRLTFSYRDPMDKMKDDEAEIFGNYRLVQGIQTPYSTVRMQNGEMRSQRFINNVSYNVGMAPTLFETKGITYNPQKSAGDNSH